LHIQFPFVALDGNYGMHQVADHLVEMEHRQIAYVPACQIGTLVCQMLVRLDQAGSDWKNINLF
jgi:DNA-binding LacI/PurR family transcriptional regulator